VRGVCHDQDDVEKRDGYGEALFRRALEDYSPRQLLYFARKGGAPPEGLALLALLFERKGD